MGVTVDGGGGMSRILVSITAIAQVKNENWLRHLLLCGIVGFLIHEWHFAEVLNIRVENKITNLKKNV